MTRKKTDRPGKVNICFEQLIFDLDFMSNEYAGIILKMIAWYSVGNSEGKERIEQMKQYIGTLPGTDKAWLTSTYRRLFKAIDDDLNRYAEVCEKRRVLALEREERKRNEREQSTTSVHTCTQKTTKDHNCAQVTTTSTNNNNNNNVSKETDNINITSSSTTIARAREGDVLLDSRLNEWGRGDIVTKDNVPELTDKWIEEVKTLVRRFNKQELTDEDVRHQYEDFKAQEAIETLQDSYDNWRKHFGNFVRKRIMEEQKNGTTGKKQAISRDEQRRLEAEERKESAARLVAKYLSKSAGSA